MTRLAWLLGVALLVGLLGSAHAIIFTLPSSEDVCFGEELGFDMVVHGTYKMIPAEGKGTLRVVVSHSVDDADAKAKPVVERDGNTGSFGFTTDQQGEYKICFSVKNQPSPHDVEVDFELKVGYETKDYAEIARKEHLKPVELEVLKLNDEAKELLTELRHIRAREQEHRSTTDSTNSAVISWTGVSLLVILVLGAYQLFYLRNFFRKKRLIN